ncbi:hypothetical protein MKX07_006421 [Trichoderma sp. CBMAI-0711]|nr:hypothetical protein MKX07_006421 [Trichoderma sp. CBMAI-0711]
MPAPGQSTTPTTRRTRKSIGVHTELSNSRKENATTDVGQSMAASRKSRSKSIGPGGLDALRQGNGNRRASLAAPTKIPRSILKPTISPLPEIPPLKSKAQRNSDSEPADAVEEIPTDEEEAEEEEENSNSDSDDGTMMSLETDEVTGTTVASEKSLVDLDEDSSTLDEALRMAARRAATQQLGDDSDDGEEIIPSFGWARKPIPQPAASDNKEPAKSPVDQHSDKTIELEMDMDITQVMGKIIKPSGPGDNEREPEAEAEVSMDVTRAFGGIISGGRHIDAPSESGEMEDATMEFTTAVGGIHYPELPDADTDYDANEDMSMELTSVMGGLLARQQEQIEAPRRQTLNQTAKQGDDADADGDETMDLYDSEDLYDSKDFYDSEDSSIESFHNPSAGLIVDKNADADVAKPNSPISVQKTTIPRPGLGSPQVAAIFDRRESLTESTSTFVAGKRAVAFSDPKVLAQELDQDSDEGARRKSGGRDATLNLREMIDSMSPKRNPLRGRKSLHIGSARGLLGKRPAELDEEAEAEENDGVKRLKGRQGSPVKNVKLQQPPSKEETTGRLRRSSRLSFDFSGKTSQSAQSSPLKGSDSATLLSQKFSRAGKENQTVHDVQIHQPLANNDPQVLETIEEHQMHLQDFLNLTSIRFMELNTTKRRHTIAPRTSQSGILPDGEDDRSLERCVVAGACTVPMLELYQHSCRELKKYISEGRRIVKEIETETFEENPPLFREYLSATPDVKALMDNQFKNVRTHARHLSKAMWYEWRMKLQDGLNEGLVSISDGMKNDLKVIEEQEKLLKSVMPNLVSRYESLLEESSSLEEAAKEIADCDPAELQAARDELTSLDDDIAQKKKLIAKLRQEFEASAADVEELTARKTQCLAEIKESQRIREECRGWTSTEVNNLKARVEAIEKEHGWAVTGIAGSTLSMTYKREIELVLDITSFQPKQPNSPIDLWYIADSRAVNPLPRTAEKEFFLQCIREHIQAMSQSRTKLSHLLSVVKTAWVKSNWISRQLSRINVIFPTKVSKTSESSIAVTSSLLLAPLETRIEVVFNLKGSSGPEGVNVDVSTDAKVIYGEQFNVGKVGEFLGTRIGKSVGAEGEPWSDVVAELYEKLIARGKKQ